MTTATIISRLSSELGVTEEKVTSWIDRWREPHRFYHNLVHLGQMFEDLREHSSRIDYCQHCIDLGLSVEPMDGFSLQGFISWAEREILSS